MAWTYDLSKLVTSGRDQVRYLVQDTDSARQLARDEEIDWALTQEMNVFMASAAILEAIANRFRGVSSKTVGSLSLSYEGADAMLRRAERLRQRGKTYQTLSAGGISLADRDTLADNTDLIQPNFRLGIHDNPGSVPSESEPE